MGQQKTIIVGGSFDGTVTVEYATDEAGTHWAPIAGFQNPGQQQVSVACRWMRVNGSRSGSANVDVAASDAGAVFAEVTGVAADITGMPPFKTVVVGPTNNTINIEVSVDGTSWAQVATFQHAGGQSFYSFASRVRAVATHGALPAIWLAAGFDEYTPFSSHEPFVSGLAPGELVPHTIYARTTGSDLTGNGTLTNPYRTFQRAALDIPLSINPCFKYTIDITDLGVEILPQDYEMPCIIGCAGTWFDPTPVVPYFTFHGPVVVRAIPKLAAAAAPMQTIDAGDGAVVAAVGPDLVKVTVAGAGWAVGALKGLKAVKTLSGGEVACDIFDNTATELFLCNTPADFNGGAGALVLAPGETLSIMEPSATLQGEPSSVKFNTLGLGAVCAGIVFQGIKVANTNPGIGGLGITRQIFPVLEGCDLIELDISDAGTLGMLSMWTTVRGLQQYSSSISPIRSYWPGVAPFLGGPILGVSAQFSSCVLDGCASLGATADFSETGALITPSYSFKNTWIINSTDDAISLRGPSRLQMDTCQIDDAAGDAIVVNGLVQAELTSVDGTGSTGIGINADNGAQVSVTACTLTGVGGDLQSGALAVTNYAGLPQFDITAVGAGGATGSGTRIH